MSRHPSIESVELGDGVTIARINGGDAWEIEVYIGLLDNEPKSKSVTLLRGDLLALAESVVGHRITVGDDGKVRLGKSVAMCLAKELLESGDGDEQIGTAPLLALRKPAAGYADLPIREKCSRDS